jgi:hypothetical protein
LVADTPSASAEVDEATMPTEKAVTKRAGVIAAARG